MTDKIAADWQLEMKKRKTDNLSNTEYTDLCRMIYRMVTGCDDQAALAWQNCSNRGSLLPGVACPPADAPSIPVASPKHVRAAQARDAAKALVACDLQLKLMVERWESWGYDQPEEKFDATKDVGERFLEVLGLETDSQRLLEILDEVIEGR